MENFLSYTNEENQKNRIKLFLEASLNRKITISEIRLFNKKNTDDKSCICYKVWLYHPGIIKDAERSYHKTETNSSKVSLDFPKIIKFKVGPLDFDDIMKEGISYPLKITDTSEYIEGTQVYTLVLAEVNVKDAYSCVVDDRPDVEFKESEINQINPNEDLFYLNRSIPYNIRKSSNSGNVSSTNKYNDHWYLLKDPKRIKYLALVSFTCNTEQIRCVGCDDTQKPDMWYCLNDKEYFCPSCYDEFHNKLNFNSHKKHKKIEVTNYSLTYTGTCNIKEHALKPLDFYCTKCRAVYCILCLTKTDHGNYKDHDIKYLHEVFVSLDQESKTLTERIRQINTTIALELAENEKITKDIQTIVTKIRDNVKETKERVIEELEMECVNRVTALASLSTELQRIISELEFKLSFIKRQYTNSDHATYIAMTNAFIQYIKEDVFNNIRVLVERDLSNYYSDLVQVIYKNIQD